MGNRGGVLPTKLCGADYGGKIRLKLTYHIFGEMIKSVDHFMVEKFRFARSDLAKNMDVTKTGNVVKQQLNLNTDRDCR